MLYLTPNFITAIQIILYNKMRKKTCKKAKIMLKYFLRKEFFLFADYNHKFNDKSMQYKMLYSLLNQKG